MNVFKKLVKQEKESSAFSEIIGKDRNIEFSDLNKLKVGDLVDIIKKYDQYVVKMKKDTQPILEQHEEYQQKVQILETNLRSKVLEFDEINSQLLEVQKHLNIELSKNIQLQQNYEFINKQNEHLKQKLEQAQSNGYQCNTPIQAKNGEEDQDPQPEQKTNIVLRADSELLMFTNEQELQHLRNLFDQLKDDVNAFIEQLGQEGKVVSDREQKKRDAAKQEKIAEKKEKKNKENEEGDDQQQESEENEAEEGDEQEEVEEDADEEEEYTLEELCGNTWDSLAQFNEQMEILVQNMKEYKEKSNFNSSNNKDLINNYETQLLNKQKQIDQFYMEKEKINEVKKQLEKDFIEINQKLADEKGRNAQLEDKLASFSKQFQELFTENETLKGQLKQLNEEKSSLSKEIGNVQNIYAQEEQKQKEEIDELQKELDEINEENERLNEELTKARQDLYLKTKELDNKDRQEKLKSAQIAKDTQKLEQKLQEAEKDLEQQIESNHQNLQRLKVLEEKRIQEKSKMKTLKDKVKELQEELNKKKLENAKDLEAKNKMLDQLEEEIAGLRSKSNVKEELTKLTLEKDVKIKNLEIQLQEQGFNLQRWEDKINEYKQQLEDLKEKNVQQEQTIKVLLERREQSIQKIQELNAQIDLMRNHSNPTTQARMNEIQNLVERASAINQSSNSLSDASGSNSNKFSNNFRTQQQDKTPKQIPNDFTISISSKGQLPPKAPQSLTNSSQPSLSKFSQNEMKYLNEMKKEMEQVYKDYISIAFGYEKNSVKENNENFMKLEKKINLSIKKAQDLMDAIEDMA
ncbi:hypothetical protein TTHERM_00049010 (macronuclear) [Tetrahymena thermophila SB210]|uniref:Uncharacterized protein n=1 Tax=Tetrahymena thermophila (strain SB210) TaxID=312017 RepID=Q23D90_TETTS|nr:hypothetical protein TTHERM_00049010 [Tetrahymena thermophila SB210]EAR94481.1 hypothetical protein TTHERM_00049010 [Tetrahymena thermophila SB210]|eukprot:XP_001014796.1 hypothetical protein TTHERM_00049010 [Tetrahymena thermophila SB210]